MLEGRWVPNSWYSRTAVYAIPCFLVECLYNGFLGVFLLGAGEVDAVQLRRLREHGRLVVALDREDEDGLGSYTRNMSSETTKFTKSERGVRFSWQKNGICPPPVSIQKCELVLFTGPEKMPHTPDSGAQKMAWLRLETLLEPVLAVTRRRVPCSHYKPSTEFSWPPYFFSCRG